MSSFSKVWRHLDLEVVKRDNHKRWEKEIAEEIARKERDLLESQRQHSKVL